MGLVARMVNAMVASSSPVEGSGTLQELGKMGLGLDSAGIRDMQKVVDRDANRPADMFGYHGHILSNLEQIGLMEETKFARAWVHSMNFE